MPRLQILTVKLFKHSFINGTYTGVSFLNKNTQTNGRTQVGFWLISNIILLNKQENPEPTIDFPWPHLISPVPVIASLCLLSQAVINIF